MGREQARRKPSRVALPIQAERGSTLEAMAVVPKKLKIGDLVEVDGRRYDVVSKAGGVTLQPAITVFADELHERHCTRPLTDQEFDELFGHLPSDAEG
jgi:hypothetical protein